MVQRHRSILILETEGLDHWQDLQNLLKEVSQYGEILDVSCVYTYLTKAQFQRYSSERLSVACVLFTPHSPEDLHNHIEKATSQAEEGRVSCDILVYDDYFSMKPGLVLPHPELHLRPQWLIPAAEISGSYTHPVLKKNLSELAQKFRQDSWGQFFAQGKTLLDFSAPQT